MEIKKFNEYLSDENAEKSELSERLMSIAGLNRAETIDFQDEN